MLRTLLDFDGPGDGYGDLDTQTAMMFSTPSFPNAGMDEAAEASKEALLDLFYAEYLGRLLHVLTRPGIGQARGSHTAGKKHRAGGKLTPEGTKGNDGDVKEENELQSDNDDNDDDDDHDHDDDRTTARTGTSMLKESAIDAKGSSDLPITASTKGLIVELVCFVTQSHGYRIKYYSLRHHVAEKVIALLDSHPEQWLKAVVVRFVRICLGLRDTFYDRYFVRCNLLEPLVRELLRLGDRYNLLSSSILDVFEFLREEPAGGMLKEYVADHFLADLEQKITYCSTFKRFADQMRSRLGNFGGSRDEDEGPGGVGKRGGSGDGDGHGDGDGDGRFDGDRGVASREGTRYGTLGEKEGDLATGKGMVSANGVGKKGRAGVGAEGVLWTARRPPANGGPMLRGMDDEDAWFDCDDDDDDNDDDDEEEEGDGNPHGSGRKEEDMELG